MRIRRFCRYLTSVCLVGAILGIVVAGTGTSARAASGRPSAAHRPGTSRLSAVGNYTYFDSLNDDEELNVNADGTVLFSSGCSGLWVQSGKAFSMDVNANCAGSTWIYTGVLTKHGISSEGTPGIFFSPSFAEGFWHATHLVT